MEIEEVRRLLADLEVVYFVDWPRAEVPAAVHRAGKAAVGHEPDGPKWYTVEDARPPAADGVRWFELPDAQVLVSRTVPQLPGSADVVSTFRPPEEQVEIARDAVAKGARVFWVEPGEGTSEEARALVEEAGLVFVDGVSIADVLAG